jgi:hypothetical protein
MVVYNPVTASDAERIRSLVASQVPASAKAGSSALVGL